MIRTGLVVFDLDGTLLRTAELDAELYQQAFLSTFCLQVSPEEWTACRDVTDEGIALELVERLRGTPPSDREMRRLREQFMSLLAGALPADPEALRVPGVTRLFPALARRGIGAAIATGAWSDAARLKIARARLDVTGVAMATCDDHRARDEILLIAIRRSGADSTLPAACVGDGPWDLEASRKLGLPFVGVDIGGTGRLADLGAKAVVRDFQDPDAFLEALERAGWSVPQVAAGAPA